MWNITKTQFRCAIWGLAALATGSAAPTFAADYLTDVTSEVYQAAGTPRELATKANVCISQHLAPGSTDSQLILNSNPEGGVIVARSATQYSDSLIQWRMRSTFTFEARDGRFRITQTNLERFNETNGSWGGIGKWWGSGWKKAEQALVQSADMVAKCVIAPSEAKPW